MKSKKTVMILPCLLCSSLIGCNAKEEKLADLVIYSHIYTAEESNNSEAQALAVKDGKYVYVGDVEGAKEYVKEGVTKVIDRRNQGLIIPGCTEGHAHYFDGVGLSSQLPGCGKSYEDVLLVLREQFENQHIKQFVSFGWVTTDLMSRRNEGHNFAKEIESYAPGIPVVLIDNSGHSAVCNETALAMAGITKENPTVRGGAVYLDTEGNPSGYVGDQAVFFVTDRTISKPLNDEQYRSACEYGMNELLRLGYTNALDAFTNMYDPTGLYEALKKMDDDNELKINIAECYNIKSFDSNVYKSRVNDVVDIVKNYSGPHCNPAYIKLFVDGVVESGTGWIFGTYKNAQEGKEHGNIIWDVPELDAIITYANSKNIVVHSHAYGDAACAAAIDSYINSNEINKNEYRNCLAHVRNIKDADVIRAAENRIPIAANLIWHTDYDERDPANKQIKDYLIDNMGEDFYYDGYPMKSLISKGAIVSSSTDAPAAMEIEGSVMNVLEVATTGITPNTDCAAFSTNELLTVREALKALTIDGAWQLGLENERGSIKVGKYADFLVLDKDFLGYSGEQLRTIADTNIVNTYFEGEVVYPVEK